MASARLLFLPLMLALAGCPVSSDFQEPIAQFSTATDKAGKALADLDAGAAQELSDLRHTDALAKPTRVQPEPDGCRPGTMSCVVELTPDLGSGDPGGALSLSSIVPEHVQAMQAISIYAKGLEDIVNADATATVKGGLDKASAAAAQLAALAGPQYKAAVDALSIPATAAATWLFGEYQDSIKLDALREATRRMEVILPDATKKFGTAADLAQEASLTHLVDDFGDAKVAFGKSATTENLDAYLAAAHRLDDALHVKPSEVFDQLKVAHSELAAALKSSDITFGQAIVQINRLATKVDQLVDIANDFKKAREKLKAKPGQMEAPQ